MICPAINIPADNFSGLPEEMGVKAFRVFFKQGRQA